MVLGKYDKIYLKIMEDPYHADLDFKEVKTFLEKLGFEYRKHKRNGTSHNIFIHPNYKGILNIPTKHGRHVKGVYIKMIREALIEMDM